MATNSTARISIKPEIDAILEEWSRKILISKMALIRRIAIDSLNYKSMDYYDSTRLKRLNWDQRKKNTKLWLSFSDQHAEVIEDAATKNRTFFVDWVEEVIEKRAIEWKEAQDVVKSKDR